MKKYCEYPECKKVLTLMSIKCKCTKMFCSKHISDYVHSCTYDYKNEHISSLMKHMSTLIIADKLDNRL